MGLETIVAGAAIGSAVIGGIGAIQQSQASASAAGFNAKVAAQNAQIATQNANYSGAEGEQNIAASGAKTRAQIGATIANQGASGVDVNSGSAVNVRESEAKLGMLNALNIRSQAARQAYGYETQASGFEGQSRLDRSEQSNDKVSGYLNAGATVLGGAGSAAKYSGYLSKGDPVGMTNTDDALFDLTD